MTADLGPAATPRPIPTPGDRMTAARQPGPTFATYLDRHDRDQLDARAATAEQERDDALDERDGLRAEINRVEQTRQEQVQALNAMLQDALWTAGQHATTAASLRQQRDRYVADLADAGNEVDQLTVDNTRLRAELGAAQEVIATIRDAGERIDRAIAHYETQQQEQAAAATLGSPAARAQDGRSEVNVPDWVLILVRGLQGYAHDHPKLYAQYAGHGDAYLSAPCPCGLLEGVPAAVRERAEQAEG